MKTQAIALILAASAILLVTVSLSPATGKAESADVVPAISEQADDGSPVKHVGMGENQPL